MEKDPQYLSKPAEFESRKEKDLFMIRVQERFLWSTFKKVTDMYKQLNQKSIPPKEERKELAQDLLLDCLCYIFEKMASESIKAFTAYFDKVLDTRIKKYKDEIVNGWNTVQGDIYEMEHQYVEINLYSENKNPYEILVDKENGGFTDKELLYSGFIEIERQKSELTAIIIDNLRLNKTYREIASLTGKTVNAIKQHVYRISQKFQERK